jgi:hypothetical protein
MLPTAQNRAKQARSFLLRRFHKAEPVVTNGTGRGARLRELVRVVITQYETARE